jgi:hypothetical protein
MRKLVLKRKVYSCRYEAFVIYNFVVMCLEYLGGEESVEEIIKDKEELRLGFPLNKLRLPPPKFWYIYIINHYPQFLVEKVFCIVVSKELFNMYL